MVTWLARIFAALAHRCHRLPIPKFTLVLLCNLFCLLKVEGQRVKESLAVLLNVDLVLGDGIDCHAGFFHGQQMRRDAPVFQNRRLRRPLPRLLRVKRGLQGFHLVCTENPVRVDDVMESPKLAE